MDRKGAFVYLCDFLKTAPQIPALWSDSWWGFFCAIASDVCKTCELGGIKSFGSDVITNYCNNIELVYKTKGGDKAIVDALVKSYQNPLNIAYKFLMTNGNPEEAYKAIAESGNGTVAKAIAEATKKQLEAMKPVEI